MGVPGALLFWETSSEWLAGFTDIAFWKETGFCRKWAQWGVVQRVKMYGVFGVFTRCFDEERNAI